MSETNRWQRVADDDPRRCQATIPTRGQCNIKAMDGSNYCPAHGGNRAASESAKKEAGLYQLEKYTARLESLKANAESRTVSSELAILRMILESKLKGIRDDHELELRSGPISDLVLKIDKLVLSMQRLDSHLSTTLDSAQALQWANDIIEIVGNHIQDSDVLSQIADEILESLTKIQKGSK